MGMGTMADAKETERTTARAGTEIWRTTTGASGAAAMTPEGRLGENRPLQLGEATSCSSCCWSMSNVSLHVPMPINIATQG